MYMQNAKYLRAIHRLGEEKSFQFSQSFDTETLADCVCIGLWLVSVSPPKLNYELKTMYKTKYALVMQSQGM